MLSLLQYPAGRTVFAIIAGVLVSLAVHRYWIRFAPLNMLARVAKRNPQRLQARFVNSNVARPTADDDSVAQLLGPDASADEIETAKYLIADLDRHHPKILDHGHQVAVTVKAMAEESGWPEAKTRRLVAEAMFHDAGWMGVAPRLIDDPGPYAESEDIDMSRHPTYGQAVIGSLAEFFGGDQSAIPHHHERWDGMGYPNAAARDEIPEGARFLAVADSFVSLTAADLGGPALSPSAALAQISAGAGTWFDPVAVRSLLATSLRRTGSAVVGGATGVSILRALSTSWASTTAGVAVAASTAVGLSAIAPASPAPIRTTENVTVTTTSPMSTDRSTTTTTTTKPTKTTKRTVTTNKVTAPPQPGKTTTTKRPTGTTSATTAPGPQTTTPPSQLAQSDNGPVASTPTTASPVTVPNQTPQPTAAPTTSPPTPTTVRFVNKAPVANQDSATVNANSGTTAAVLSNDGDPEGRLNAASLRVVSGGSLGSASVQGSSIRYQAGANGGTDQVAYQVCDSDGGCATATLVVTIVAPINAVDDRVNVPANQSIAVRIGVLYNDVGRPDSSTLAVVAPPSVGSASVSGGSISFTVAGGMAPGSSTSLRYRICDSNGTCDEAVATIST